jgi:alanine racemase
MRPTRAEISLNAIKHNLLKVKERVGKDTRVMGVVKANAYGHGMVEVAKSILAPQKIVDYLGVAILEEGITLRKNNISAPVHCFTHPMESQIEDFVKYKIEPSIASIEFARLFSSTAEASGIICPVQIKIDTGMGRVGMNFRDAIHMIKEIKKLPNIQIKGIFSHFATSDEKDKTFANEQLNRFKEIKNALNSEEYKDIIFHTANSGAILDMKDSYFDMVRPGIIMYGYYPSHETTESIELKPALSLKSKISFIKQVSPNTSISYSRRYFTDTHTEIATIPIGYGDGLNRGLTNKGKIIIGSKIYQISGTVCMDQVMTDLGLDSNVNLGDDVIFIGSNGKVSLSAWDVADILNTIPYEICCNISSRVERIYID